MLSRSEFQKITNVSRETLQAFDTWKDLLERWNQRINLVSPNAVQDYWGRHALDSWQLWLHVPETADTFLDLGSGAGFPGLALGIGCHQRGRGQVTLVESAGKKANFLRTVARELGLPVTVWADRLENLAPKPYDVITARAFAPLPRLFTYAQPFWGRDTISLLLKGENVSEELTEAEKTWISNVESFPSESDSRGIILKVTGLSKKTT